MQTVLSLQIQTELRFLVFLFVSLPACVLWMKNLQITGMFKKGWGKKAKSQIKLCCVSSISTIHHIWRSLNPRQSMHPDHTFQFIIMNRYTHKIWLLGMVFSTATSTWSRPSPGFSLSASYWPMRSSSPSLQSSPCWKEFCLLWRYGTHSLNIREHRERQDITHCTHTHPTTFLSSHKHIG